MGDALALLVEVGEGGGADGLGLVGEGLAVAEPPRRPVQPVRAAQQLLPLLELEVRRVGRGRGVVGVAGPEEGGAVVGEVAQLALVAVDVGFVVSEALVDLGARGRGDVLLFEAHLAELTMFVSCVVLL